MDKRPTENTFLENLKKNIFFYCFLFVLTLHMPLVFYRYSNTIVSYTYDEINSNISRVKLIIKSIQSPSEKKRKKLVSKVIKKKGKTVQKQKKNVAQANQNPIKEHTAKKAQSAKGINDELAKYKKYIGETLNRNRKYPKISQRRKQQGTVKVSFVIEKSGLIRNVKLTGPSKYSLLNKAALRAIRKVNKFKPFPTVLDKSSIEFIQPFDFNLN